MRKIGNVFLPLGAILVIVGTLMKILHWEYASIIMLCGFISGTIGLISVYNSFKEKTINKLGVVLIMLGSALIILGALLKILHLQYANTSILVGMIIGLVGVGIIYYKYNKSKEDSNVEEKSEEN